MTYASEVLADAPVAWWRLGEASGTVAADSNGGGTTFPGTYTGSPTLAQPGIAGGGADTAVLFGASTKYVDMGNVLANPDAGSGWSLEAWVKLPSGFGAGTFDAIVAKGNSSWRLARNGSTTNQVQFCTTGAAALAATCPNIADGNWHHLVVTVSAAHSAVIYYDGASVATTALTAVATTTDPLRIANNSGNGTWWNGLIDEVAVYQSVLSATRVAAHHTAGLGGVASAAGSLTLSGSAGASAAAGTAGSLTLGGSTIAPIVANGSLTLGSPAAAARPVYLASFTVDVGMEASDIPMLPADTPTVDFVGDDASDLVSYPDPVLDQWGRPIAS